MLKKTSREASPIKSVKKEEKEPQNGEFNSKLGAFAQMLIKSEQDIQSPLMKSKDY